MYTIKVYKVKEQNQIETTQSHSIRNYNSN